MTSRRTKLQKEKVSKLLSSEDHRLARDYHSKIFPEEYDALFDSWTDRKMRSQGLNPLCIDYINQVNLRRNHLGFESISKNQNTYAWIYQKVIAKEFDYLDSLLSDIDIITRSS